MAGRCPVRPGTNPFTEAELATLEKLDGMEGRAAVESSPELAYGATLLAAAATDKVLLYLQLGDGEILSVSAPGPLPGRCHRMTG